MTYWDLMQGFWSTFPWWAPLLFVFVVFALLMVATIRHRKSRP